MIKGFVIIGLLISLNFAIAQPCIKFCNYTNGTWKTYKAGDKITMILKNNNHEMKFVIAYIYDSGLVTTSNQHVLYKDILALSYGSSSYLFLCYYISMYFVSCPFILADKTAPFYVSDIPLRLSISAIDIALGTYVLYKLNIRNGFRKLCKLDKRSYEIKYFRDISLIGK
jgi:hypothetical protein